MSGRTLDGRPLTPGFNVDRIDIPAGLAAAEACGYDSEHDQMLVIYALQRWARGEESGAERTWRSYFPRDFTSWIRIISAAQAGAARDPVEPQVREREFQSPAEHQAELDAWGAKP